MKAVISFLIIPMLMLVSCSPEPRCTTFGGDPCDDGLLVNVNFQVYDRITDDPIGLASIYVEYNVGKTATLITGEHSGSAFLQRVRSVTYIEVSAEGYYTKIFSNGVNIEYHGRVTIYLDPIPD